MKQKCQVKNDKQSVAYDKLIEEQKEVERAID